MYEEVFDDGLSVFIEFAVPAGEANTVGIYIDHNMGGLVKDVFLAGRLDDVRTGSLRGPCARCPLRAIV